MTRKYLLRMEEGIRAVKPNRAHAVLLAIATKIERCTIMTVNVDRLHQRAGSKDVIEMHGALFDLLCSRCELSTATRFIRRTRHPTEVHDVRRDAATRHAAVR